MEQLETLFNCIICLNTATEPHICPHCSKLGCRACFQRALRTNNVCPHCRAHLTKEELVYLRWGGELSTHIHHMRSQAGLDPEEQCAQHGKPLSTFCQTCAQCVCVNCALFGMHQGHAMRDLDEVYREHVGKMGGHVAALRAAQGRLLEQMQDVEKNVTMILRCHASVRADIERYCDSLDKRMDDELKRKLAVLMFRKNRLYEHTQEVTSELAAVDARLRSDERVGLISTSAEVMHTFTKLLQTANEEFNFEPVVADFASELIPPAVSHDVILPRFSGLLDRPAPGEPFLSDVLWSSGLGWRLKIYPAGAQDAFNRFLSVYVELCEGPPRGAVDSAWECEYVVELLRPGAGQAFARQYVSRFELGECWGYERYYPLHSIEEEFIHADGSIHLRISLALTSYHQICQAQAWRLKEMERERNAWLSGELHDMHQQQQLEQHLEQQHEQQQQQQQQRIRIGSDSAAGTGEGGSSMGMAANMEYASSAPLSSSGSSGNLSGSSSSIGGGGGGSAEVGASGTSGAGLLPMRGATAGGSVLGEHLPSAFLAPISSHSSSLSLTGASNSLSVSPRMSSSSRTTVPYTRVSIDRGSRSESVASSAGSTSSMPVMTSSVSRSASAGVSAGTGSGSGGGAAASVLVASSGSAPIPVLSLKRISSSALESGASREVASAPAATITAPPSITLSGGSSGSSSMTATTDTQSSFTSLASPTSSAPRFTSTTLFTILPSASASQGANIAPSVPPPTSIPSSNLSSTLVSSAVSSPSSYSSSILSAPSQSLSSRRTELLNSTPLSPSSTTATTTLSFASHTPRTPRVLPSSPRFRSISLADTTTSASDGPLAHTLSTSLAPTLSAHANSPLSPSSLMHGLHLSAASNFTTNTTTTPTTATTTSCVSCAPNPSVYPPTSTTASSVSALSSSSVLSTHPSEHSLRPLRLTPDRSHASLPSHSATTPLFDDDELVTMEALQPEGLEVLLPGAGAGVGAANASARSSCDTCLPVDEVRLTGDRLS